MSELFRASPLSDPELAAELHRRGCTYPRRRSSTSSTMRMPSRSSVEVLGGRWVEDNFRTLYEAARREQEPGPRPAVQRSVSGLAGADPVDVARVGELIKPPVLDVPRLLSRQRLIAQLVEGLDEPKRPTQVLVGAGGYGKSIVALATAQRAEARHIMPLWVPASDLDALVDGLHRAAIWIGSTAVEIDAALAAQSATTGSPACGPCSTPHLTSGSSSSTTPAPKLSAIPVGSTAARWARPWSRPATAIRQPGAPTPR